MCASIVVIINGSAGGADKQGLAKTLEESFQSAGIEVKIVLPQSGTAIREAALRAVQTRPSRLLPAAVTAPLMPLRRRWLELPSLWVYCRWAHLTTLPKT